MFIMCQSIYICSVSASVTLNARRQETHYSTLSFACFAQRERERERERERVHECVTERERERMHECVTQRERMHECATQ